MISVCWKMSQAFVVCGFSTQPCVCLIEVVVVGKLTLPFVSFFAVGTGSTEGPALIPVSLILMILISWPVFVVLRISQLRISSLRQAFVLGSSKSQQRLRWVQKCRTEAQYPMRCLAEAEGGLKVEGLTL